MSEEVAATVVEDKFYIVESPLGRAPYSLISEKEALDMGLDLATLGSLDTWLSTNSRLRVPNDYMQQYYGLPIDNWVHNIDLVARVQQRYLPVLAELVNSLKSYEAWYEVDKPETKQFALSQVYLVDGEIDIRFRNLETKEAYLKATAAVNKAEFLMDLFNAY